MARARRKPVVDLAELLGSWELHLRRAQVGRDGQVLRRRRPDLPRLVRARRPAVVDRHQLREFVDALLAEGARPSTAVFRHLAVRRFSAWLTEEGEQASEPLLGMRAPKLDKPVVEPVSDDQLRAMLKACRGADLRDKRDEAILRLMFTTGARAGEVVALQVTDLSLRTDPATATIRRGKGGTGRIVPLPPRSPEHWTATVRARRTHRLAVSPTLWVGDRGKGFTYDALHKTLAMRAERAGVVGFHPRMLRHTAAHRWLAKAPRAA